MNSDQDSHRQLHLSGPVRGAEPGWLISLDSASHDLVLSVLEHFEGESMSPAHKAELIGRLLYTCFGSSICNVMKSVKDGASGKEILDKIKHLSAQTKKHVPASLHDATEDALLEHQFLAKSTPTQAETPPRIVRNNESFFANGITTTPCGLQAVNTLDKQIHGNGDQLLLVIRCLQHEMTLQDLWRSNQKDDIIHMIAARLNARVDIIHNDFDQQVVETRAKIFARLSAFAYDSSAGLHESVLTRPHVHPETDMELRSPTPLVLKKQPTLDSTPSVETKLPATPIPKYKVNLVKSASNRIGNTYSELVAATRRPESDRDRGYNRYTNGGKGAARLAKKLEKESESRKKLKTRTGKRRHSSPGPRQPRKKRARY